MPIHKWFKSELDILEAGKEYFPVVEQTPKEVFKRTSYRMKAYIISMVNDRESTIGTRRLVRSIQETKSNLDVFTFNAITPENLDDTMKTLFVRNPYKQIGWTWPIKPEENRWDIATGLKLSCYDSGKKPPTPRIAAMLSHYTLWKTCVDHNETIMILEHDAIMNRRFDYKDIKEYFTGMVLGLNNPMKATRKASLFHQKVLEGQMKPIMETPTIDVPEVPQGLAGNSAYLIKPKGARKLMELVAQHGLWPNDALMCKQLFPRGQLQVTTKYYTHVQGLRSSTST